MECFGVSTGLRFLNIKPNTQFNNAEEFNFESRLQISVKRACKQEGVQGREGSLTRFQAFEDGPNTFPRGWPSGGSGCTSQAHLPGIKEVSSPALDLWNSL